VYIGCKLCDGDRELSKHVAVYIGCKLCDGDRKLSKHVAVYITQTDCSDIYCCGADCALVGCNEQ